MTLRAPEAREAVGATQRKAMTPARRAKVLAAHDGHCAFPGCEEVGALEIDHVIALELGGREDDDNLQPLCRTHHSRKTALDAKLIAKMRRRQKKDNGVWPKSQYRMRGGGFTPGRNRREELNR